MVSLTRQNYKYFAEKLQAADTKARIKILRQIRTRMKIRFMKLYRLFRLKKYGEPIGPPLPISKKNIKSSLPLSEPLHAIHEEGESDHEECKFDSQGFLESLRDNIYEDIIYEFILLHADSVVRV